MLVGALRRSCCILSSLKSGGIRKVHGQETTGLGCLSGNSPPSTPCANVLMLPARCATMPHVDILKRCFPMTPRMINRLFFRAGTRALLAGTLMLAPVARVAAQMPLDRDVVRRMQWFREAKFGMLITWGLYSIPAGEWKGQEYPGIGEWIQNWAHIPVEEYARLAAQFNPVKFNADEWAGLARQAGMKCVVPMPKHHDGFAMFASKASTFNIVDATPFKRDPMKELAEACRKQGLRMGVYYSQAQDWHHPGGAVMLGSWDPAQKGDFDDYLNKIAIPQIRELLTGYGPIALIWFDTPMHMTPERAMGP